MFIVIFGNGLALRGPNGAHSVHVAVDNMAAEQRSMFVQFLLGALCFLASNNLQLFVYFQVQTALIAGVPMVGVCGPRVQFTTKHVGVRFFSR